jgi:type IV pilus assembly protein PilW
MIFQPTPVIRRRHPEQRGFTMVELMVSITIGLFLIGGLLTLVQAMKRTTTSQNGLSQLQDNERMAMQLMTDVIQSSGYFINPLSQSAQSSFPAIAAYSYAGPPAALTDAFTSSGQAVAGTSVATATGDRITLRYWTTGSDKVINCTGNQYTAGAAVFVNTFNIDTNGNLQCLLVINGAVKTPVPLISGLKSMSILYGVVTNTAVNNNSADTYLTAANVTAGSYWGAVKSVKVTLTFVNPLYGTLPGQTTSGNIQQYIAFTRVIAVMGNTGVTTT